MSFSRIIRIAIACSLLLFTASIHAFTIRPIDGLWGFDSESNLGIGRAFNIELQGDVLVAVMYAYNAQRAPTFYTVAGALDASNRMSGTLAEPTGGTCLGCTPQAGRVLATYGTVTFEFTSSTTGFATLPGEARKAISKGNFALPRIPSTLTGAWTFTYVLSSGTVALTDMTFFTSSLAGTAQGSGFAYDPTSRVGCEFQTSGTAAGYLLCVKLTSFGSTDRSMILKTWGDRMDGAWAYGTGASGNFYVFTGTRLVSGISNNQVTIKTGQKHELEAASFRGAINELAALIERDPTLLQSLK